MATSKEYLNFILEQLAQLDGISHRQMMGEYMIYYNGKLAAYLCDNRLLVKSTKAALDYIENHVFEPPYDGAKDMLLVENADDAEYLTGLFNAVYDDLPTPKNKKNKNKV